MAISDLLEGLYQRKSIRAIDRQFGQFIGEQLGDKDDPMVGWATLVSFELGKGNVCVDLSSLDAAALFDLPPAEALLIAAQLDPENALVYMAQSNVVGEGKEPTPLILHGKRLYLNRYWQAEQRVAEGIVSRCNPVLLPDGARATLDALFEPDIALLKTLYAGWGEHEKAQKLLDFFDVVQPDIIDMNALQRTLDTDASAVDILAYVPEAARLNWQKVAAAAALSYRFSVISGGPGTGKTTTVAKLLAALVISSGKPNGPEIKLVAPTGKAANRLMESIGKAVDALPVSHDVRGKIPVQASTIHRLLGAIPNRVDFRHHQNNRLHLDILVVDEASMVDLPLMARLLAALPEHARVILLGDRDQLASVEAGAVLGDICLGVDKGYSNERAAELTSLTGFNLSGLASVPAVADSVCLLRKSYRFHAQSGVGQLAFAINTGDTRLLDRVLRHGYSDILLHDLNGDVYEQAIVLAVEGYRRYLEALKAGDDHRSVLAYFSDIRVLCALAEGPFGVKGLNSAIEKALADKHLIALGEETFYPGRPVMVTQNDHGLGLYNGDIGIVVKQDDGLRVVFELSDGSVKAFLPSRLPEHQTAYAMTVHKSQGSEFSHTIMVLSPTHSPVMTRELVYTGVTRAKDRLDVFATRASLERAVRRKTSRFSGLADALGVR
ncbi:exodeoxyribonuclease V subunit alpha [Enterovibrio nigricans]|uniref:RecBCD enzyme subunit RecD n=1 Tax=Enterovibrio nigricans DSM 22720 TaxID=1121868 RepID=A0A1T4UCB8_9GAMM|nr:exodeoxyribonuclease V subunit alpha [Enterovibrio nigricans]SKA50246.1 DNA helicase/exodeoxyribonuclease V, alpha subunit [Enterovibrio nigricans DSM 22720]